MRSRSRTDHDQRLPISTNAISGGTRASQAACGCKGWCGNRYTTAPIGNTGPVSQGYVHWRLAPYVKNTQLWICPSMGTTCRPDVNDESSYLWSLVIRNTVPTLYLEGETEAFIRAPAELPIIQDAVSWLDPSGCANLYVSATSPADRATCHGDGGAAPMNVGFLDGHVKSMPIMQWWKTLQASQPWR